MDPVTLASIWLQSYVKDDYKLNFERISPSSLSPSFPSLVVSKDALPLKQSNPIKHA